METMQVCYTADKYYEQCLEEMVHQGEDCDKGYNSLFTAQSTAINDSHVDELFHLRRHKLPPFKGWENLEPIT